MRRIANEDCFRKPCYPCSTQIQYNCRERCDKKLSSKVAFNNKEMLASTTASTMDSDGNPDGEEPGYADEHCNKGSQSKSSNDDSSKDKIDGLCCGSENSSIRNAFSYWQENLCEESSPLEILHN